MKKTISLIILTVFASHVSLFAQAATMEATASTATVPNTQTASKEPTGTAAAQSSRAGRSGSWQNWAFAGGALVIAAVGVICVAMSSGHDNPTAH
ncbi:MAG: hypothetical protein HW387_76 [Parachlamydiales bacterium]|nr:hypothetical protein [Parachlamydiales bacterium]